MSIKEVIEAIRAEELTEAGKKEAGYSVAAVEKFRQDVAEVLAQEESRIAEYVGRLESENAALTAALEEASQVTPSTPVPDVSDSVNMLATAERVAREHIEGAKQEAKGIIDAAYTDADNIIATRRAEYDQVNSQIAELSEALDNLRQNAVNSVLPLLRGPSTAPVSEETPVVVEESSETLDEAPVLVEEPVSAEEPATSDDDSFTYPEFPVVETGTETVIDDEDDE